MPKIKNWSKTIDRDVKDLDGLLAGTVKEWTHDKTGEKLSVEWFGKDENRDTFYTVKKSVDENPLGASTLKEAIDMATYMMKNNTNGFAE